MWNRRLGPLLRMSVPAECLLLPVALLQLMEVHGYDPMTCGKRPLVPNQGDSMQTVGGINTLPGMWPWLVSIQATSSKGAWHLCAGTLLAPRWVLSAAHCFESWKRLLQPWRTVIGATDLSNLPDTVQLRSVLRVIAYQEYDSQTKANDIALIELSSPVTFSNYVQPACLPHVTLDSETFLSDCYITGWGNATQRDRKINDILQESKVKILEAKKCNSSWWYNGAMTPYTLCARHEDGVNETCQEDSGGPLMCKTSPNSLFYLVGITSWLKDCDEGAIPGVYTSTQPFLQWIHGEIAKIEGASLQRKKERTHSGAFKPVISQSPEKQMETDKLYFLRKDRPEMIAVPLLRDGRQAVSSTSPEMKIVPLHKEAPSGSFSPSQEMDLVPLPTEVPLKTTDVSSEVDKVLLSKEISSVAPLIHPEMDKFYPSRFSSGKT